MKISDKMSSFFNCCCWKSTPRPTEDDAVDDQKYRRSDEPPMSKSDRFVLFSADGSKITFVNSPVSIDMGDNPFSIGNR